ncbi:MAG: YIP1 family protein [Paracoccaceae bacterium]
MIDGTLTGLLLAARYTVQDPRAAARALMTMNPSATVRWMAFGLAITGSTVLTVLMVQLLPGGAEPEIMRVLANPIALSLTQGVVMLIAVQLMYHVGRLAGGQGGFADALLLMSWMQIILLMVQIVQLLLELVSPPAAGVLGLFGFGLMLWLITHFVAELHGFTSLGAVFAGIIGTTIAAAFAVALLLVSLVGV